MKPHYEDDLITLYHADCLAVLRTLPDNSVDAIVTDPPYGLSNTKPAQVADVLKAWVTGDTEAVPAKKGGFMGKDWDSFVPPPVVWEECMRVLKPGGHMAVFAGARTQDLMGLSIRLAGFEIREGMGWIFGSGFPKSHDIGKAIDKKRDDNNDWKTVGSFLKSHRVSAGFATRNSFADKILNGHSNLDSAAANLSNWENGLSFPTWERWEQLKGLLDLPDDMDAEVWRLNGRKGTPGEAWGKREVLSTREVKDIRNGHGRKYGGAMFAGEETGMIEHRETAPATPESEKWSGWGTALKPAIEPIILARKPLVGTVAANVLAHGVGGLNIDACRVEATDSQLAEKYASVQNAPPRRNNVFGRDARARAGAAPHSAGRFPANVLLDEHAAQEMDEQSGVLKSGAKLPHHVMKNAGNVYGTYGPMTGHNIPADSGGASRFFPVFKYQAKAPKKERPVIEREDGSKIQHPTVKPLKLLDWLVTLIAPPGGTVLDPFAGSGTTLEAARDNGFNAIGIEQSADFVELIQHRLGAGQTTLTVDDVVNDGVVPDECESPTIANTGNQSLKETL